MIHLTQAQFAKLEVLGDDPRTKVIGTLQDCPVIEHYGVSGNRSHDPKLAILAPNGRLRGMGHEMYREFKVKRVLRR